MVVRLAAEQVVEGRHLAHFYLFAVNFYGQCSVLDVRLVPVHMGLWNYCRKKNRRRQPPSNAQPSSDTTVAGPSV